MFMLFMYILWHFQIKNVNHVLVHLFPYFITIYKVLTLMQIMRFVLYIHNNLIVCRQLGHCFDNGEVNYILAF